MPQELYFEDFYVGQKFDSIGSHKVTTQEIKEFGQKYDLPLEVTLGGAATMYPELARKVIKEKNAKK